jgi:long-chain acyl-CoA synthetase
MELKEINSLVELFFKKFEEITSDDLEKMKKTFLVPLKTKKKNDNFLYSSYTWEATSTRIKVLSNYLINIISKGDRCILLSENRPEWLFSDIAIMNAGGVTVPLFTTYSESDYKYIINNCEPKICIISNNEQFKKIKNYIKDETILISIEKFDENIVCFDEIFNNHPKEIDQY